MESTARRNRLSGRKSFEAIYADSFRGTNGLFKVYLHPNGLGLARFGFSVRETSGAVVRNRIRRRLREASKPLLERCAGYDAVIRTTGAAAEIPFLQMTNEIDVAVEQALAKGMSA